MLIEYGLFQTRQKSLPMQGTKSINKKLCISKQKIKKSCYALAVSSVYIGEKVIRRKEGYNG